MTLAGMVSEKQFWPRNDDILGKNFIPGPLPQKKGLPEILLMELITLALHLPVNPLQSRAVAAMKVKRIHRLRLTVLL